jgi:hypothetical protein
LGRTRIAARTTGRALRDTVSLADLALLASIALLKSMTLLKLTSSTLMLKPTRPFPAGKTKSP